jgi:hypothetical protein
LIIPGLPLPSKKIKDEDNKLFDFKPISSQEVKNKWIKKKETIDTS